MPSPHPDRAAVDRIESVLHNASSPPSADTLVGLVGEIQVLLQRLSIKANGIAAKEVRNDCAALCLTLANAALTHEAFLSCGLTEDILTFATAPERRHEYAKNVKGIEIPDYSYKRLLWDCLYSLCGHKQNAELMLRRGLLSVLTMYVDVDGENEMARRWPTVPLQQLQYDSLLLIAKAADNHPEYFSAARAAPRVLSFLSQAPTEALRTASLQTLYHLANSPNRAACVAAGTVPAMLKLLQAETNVDVKKECFQIISDLCSTAEGPDSHSNVAHACKQFRECGGVEALCQHMAHDVWQKPKLQELVDALVQCVWNAVIGTQENTQKFLDLSGVMLLLDVLDRAPYWLQLPTMSCLVDLFSTSPAAVGQAGMWSSKAARAPVQQLFVRLWMEVESRVNPKVNSILYPVDVLTPEAAEETKTKLYCMFRFFSFKPHEKLNYDEKIALVYISQHLEELRDRKHEADLDQLRVEGIKAVSGDREQLQAEAAARAARRKRVSDEIASLQAQKENFVKEDERTFYKSLIKNTGDDLQQTNTGGHGLTITQAKMRKAEMLKESFRSQLTADAEKAMSYASTHAPTHAQPPKEPKAGKDDRFRRHHLPPLSAQPKVGHGYGYNLTGTGSTPRMGMGMGGVSAPRVRTSSLA